MSNMDSAVIPVMDLMIGQIVWAKGGNRDAYRPLESRLTNDSQPLAVARAIFAQTGCPWLYVADIDSFSGANPAWPVFETLVDAGFHLMIDAHWTCGNRIDEAIQRLSDSAKAAKVKLIISTETLDTVAQFELFEKVIDAGIVPVFSLDMKGTNVIARDSSVAALTPLELVHHAWERGVRHMIQLDLTTVGSNAKDSLQTDSMPADKLEEQNERLVLLREIANELPEMCLISGGGMRDHADCQQMLSAGCQHVLVASAIYEGKLTPDEIAELRPFRCDDQTRAAFVRGSGCTLD